jgi:tetratricopeptide (TPR) repeat protein
VDPHDRPGSSAHRTRIDRALRRCLEWSRNGRHLRIITEVDRALPAIGDQPRLEAQLLIWKAQAHLALGDPDSAYPAASRSWNLDPSPHACHLLSNALAAVGQPDDAEELLRSGWEIFPEAFHLPVQLAILLADQGRHPEALDAIDELPRSAALPDDLGVFLLGLHANLLAAMGRWSEADGVLRAGRTEHPGSDLLEGAHTSLGEAWDRFRARETLADSWRDGLVALDGVAAEVDEAVIRHGGVHDLPVLVTLAARRLWRAYLEGHDPHPQAPEAWGLALVLAVLELDGEPIPVAIMARPSRTSVSTTRAALARFRQFLGTLEPSLARRAFAGRTNPQLVRSSTPPDDPRHGTIVPFPST